MSQLNRPCIIWGSTGQAKVAYDILLQEGTKIIHLFDNNINVKSPLPGIPMSYGTDGLLSFIDTLINSELKPADIDCIAAIGGGNGEAREAMTRLMESHGFKPRSLMHKSALISPLADIGQNVQLLAGTIIGAFASIGDFTIMNSGANADHDCVIGNGCHLAPRATLAGEVVVGNDVFIGTNATVLPRIRIEDKAVIGAGAVVTKDIPKGVTVIGNPARVLTETTS
jgi:sugar O-acyltransferase (sialic acid O-acetyltransferase NeuD family)